MSLMMPATNSPQANAVLTERGDSVPVLLVVHEMAHHVEFMNTGRLSGHGDEFDVVLRGLIEDRPEGRPSIVLSVEARKSRRPTFTGSWRVTFSPKPLPQDRLKSVSQKSTP